MAHRNPKAKPLPKPQTGLERRGNKDAVKQARSNANQIRNNIKKSLTKFGEATSPKPSRSETTPAVSNTPVKSKRFEGFTDAVKELPWAANPNKPKRENVVTKDSTVTTFSGHTVKPNSAHARSNHERQQIEYTSEKERDQKDIDVIAKRLEDGEPMKLTTDPATWSPAQRLKYDPITGIRRDLLNAAPIIDKYQHTDPSFRIPEGVLQSFSRGKEIARGRYSYGMDEEEWKKTNENNYYKELLYNPETGQYELIPVLKPNANMPRITGDSDFFGRFYEKYTYKKGGKLYLKDDAPEVPLEFDDEGNLEKINYKDGITLSDGTFIPFEEYGEEMQRQLEDDWTTYCILSNASVIPSRALTEKMKYTAGWNPEESDSLLDIGRDWLGGVLHSKSSGDYNNPQEAANAMFAQNAIHTFKNVGGYLKNYLYTPLRKGDIQTAVLNGLVNLAETCDYAGVGTRALVAPYIGAEYEKEDSALERLGKAYTTHANYDPDTGDVAGDMAAYMLFDPSVYLTLGLSAGAKLSARSFSKFATSTLRNRLIDFGEDLTKYETKLERGYKSVARDIAFADEKVLQKHAERLADILKDSKYVDAHSQYYLADEILNDLRGIQNQKSFVVVKSITGLSDFVNGVDTFFLKGGLYLPYSAIKAFKGSQALLRSNSYVAKRLTARTLSQFQNAQRIYKNFSGNGSIMNFHNIIDGFKSLRSLDNTDALKQVSLQKIRKGYMDQQNELIAALNRFKSSELGFTTRLGMLYDEIEKIFRIENGTGPRTLDELEDHIIKMSAKASDVSHGSDDIFENMLMRVEEAKKVIELAQIDDAKKWVSSIKNSSSVDELRGIYSEYLSLNNAHPVADIEDLVSGKYQELVGEAQGISPELVKVPDDLLAGVAKANGVDDIPVLTSKPLDRAHEACKQSVRNVKKEFDNLVKNLEDAEKAAFEGKVSDHSPEHIQYILNNSYVKELRNTLGNLSDKELSELTMDMLVQQTGKALDSLRGIFKDVSSLEELEEELGKIVVTKADGTEATALDYYRLVRTTESPLSYLPTESRIVKTFDAKEISGLLKKHGDEVPEGMVDHFEEQLHVTLSDSDLRDVRLSHETAQLHEEALRKAKREMRADPNGISKQKEELIHALKKSVVKKADGTETTAWAEYAELVKKRNKYQTKEEASGLVNSLDVAFNDLLDATAITKAQAEQIKEVNVALSSFLDKALDSSVLMGAVNQFDETGKYGYLVKYKTEIFDFLRANVEEGRAVPYIDRLYHSIDSIENWCDSLKAYSNFSVTLKRLGLSQRELDAVREYVLGKNASYFSHMSRKSTYFFDNMEKGIKQYLGPDHYFDPDKLYKIGNAVSQLALDLPKGAVKSIFNISQFSKDLDSLFEVLYDPALIKEVSAVYDCEHPVVKQMMETQSKFKALRVDEFDEQNIIDNVVDFLKQQEEQKIIEESTDPVEELIREEQWRIESLPISDEEKALRLGALPERIKSGVEEDLAVIIPDYYGSLDHVAAGFKSIKNRISDVSDFYKNRYFQWLDNGKVFGVRISDGVVDDFLNGTFKHIVNVKKIVKELDNNIPGTDFKVSSLLSEDLKKELDAFANKKLDDFGWGLSNDMFDINAIIRSMNLCYDFERSLDDFLLRLELEFKSIKDKGLELGDFTPELRSKPTKSPYKKVHHSLKQSRVRGRRDYFGKTPIQNAKYGSKAKTARIVNDIENTRHLESIKTSQVLPETVELNRDLKALIDSFNLSDVQVIKAKRIFAKDRFAAKFDVLPEILSKYAHDTKIPGAITNNLTVFTNVLPLLKDCTPKELEQFASYLIKFSDILDTMFVRLPKLDAGFGYAGHVENVLVELNQSSALLQQDLLRFQESVNNRLFKDALGITETSPFIKDVFNSILNVYEAPAIIRLCDVVKEEVKSINSINASQVASCLNSNEFEGFGDLYPSYGFPMGTSAELRYDMSGQAFAVKNSYDIDNISRICNLDRTREGHIPLENITVSNTIKETSDLVLEAQKIIDDLAATERIIKSSQEQLDRIEDINVQMASRYKLEKRLEEDYDTPEGYEWALKNTTDAEYIKAIKKEQREADALRAQLEKFDSKQLSDLNIGPLEDIHVERLERAEHEKAVLKKRQREITQKLQSNYEYLKNGDICDGVVITQSRLRPLLSDVQHVLENTDTFLRYVVDMHNIPPHELMSLNKFANQFRYMRDDKFKFKENEFLASISTLDDYNSIINQTKKFALGLDTSSPYHYLVYLDEVKTIEDGFVIVDLLYDSFYKQIDLMKKAAQGNIADGLIHVPQEYKSTVARLMQAGFDSVKLDIPNEALLKLLQGDGLDLVYKGVSKSYFDTIYYRSKISGNHAASATIADILETRKSRIGWAKKFASSDNTIREEAFAELENSQIELEEIMKEVSGTPYEQACRTYLDQLQNGLYKAQTLQVMDFITKDAEHLITELLYHNHTIVLPLKYSDDFEVYGKYLTKLKEILEKDPLYIESNIHDPFADHIWISLDRDATPRIVNDTKYVKEDTQFELGGKTYDPKELNEHYQHNGLPDGVELTEDMLKDVDSDVLKTYCDRISNYIRNCYTKLDFLSEGAIRGSAIAPYSLMKHRALRKAAPFDFLANSIRSSGTCDQRLFHTSQFDFSILGENEFRLKLGGHYDDTDILQNIKYCYDDLAGTVSTERMYIANFFDENSHCKFENVFGPDLSTTDKLAILKDNPDQCVLTLLHDKNTMTGFRVKKLNITDELSVAQAEASHAIIADYETYVEMTRLINNSEFDKTWMKVWAKVVFFLKVGHLCNPGTWLRNWMDATIKATSATGNIGTTASGQIRAMKYLMDYSKIVKEIRDTYGVHHLNTTRIDSEWDAICRKVGVKDFTKEQFDFLESWLKVSLSGGESRMLQEMLKIQKYDPWRSANLKPGNSFTSAGRAAMRNEYDFIGSDLFRFEQIGEDEISNLIKEGCTKGEKIFADDFSFEEFWQVFNQRKNPKTAYIDDNDLYEKYKQTVQNILNIRSNNLFRGNRSLSSQVDYMCSFFLKPMSKVEQIVRLGQFLNLEEMGFTRSEIFKSIADTQFEYELKSSRIKGAELIMTYFNFEYNNLRYWCNMLEQKPEFLYVLEQLWDDFSWEASQQYYEDEDIYNNKSITYMMANGALPIGSSGLYLKTFPSALGALNWFYGMPSQYMTSVVPPLEFLSKEMLFRMGGDYAEWLSNMDYSYSDQETWEKALSLVPIAGTMYTRYWQHFRERMPWLRLDEGTVGRNLVHYNPSVFGAVYRYNKIRQDSFEDFQKSLEKQGKWYDCNTDKVVDIKYKNTYGLNNPDLSFEEIDTFKRLYRNESWDNNWGGVIAKGRFSRTDKALFDGKGNPKEMGLNRYRNLSIPGEWEALCHDMRRYHGMVWDRNSDKFVHYWEWKNEKLNRDDLSWDEKQFYEAEKGRFWVPDEHKFMPLLEIMEKYDFAVPKDKRFDYFMDFMGAYRGYRNGYFHGKWRHFKRWINYGDNPPALQYIRKPFNSGTTFNVNGKPFGYSYTSSGQYAALRMAVSGYKAYDDYYKFEFKYNYDYRMPHPIGQMRGYNPIIRYHIPPS